MPILHVAGESKHLHHLLDWLWTEVRTKYGIQAYAFETKRTELGSQDRQHMLALTLQSCATLRSLAEHIDARQAYSFYALLCRFAS